MASPRQKKQEQAGDGGFVCQHPQDRYDAAEPQRVKEVPADPRPTPVTR